MDNILHETNLDCSFFTKKTQINVFDQRKLYKQYKQLIEDSYNFKQTDPALSDILEYNALKLLDQLNRLKYLN